MEGIVGIAFMVSVRYCQCELMLSLGRSLLCHCDNFTSCVLCEKHVTVVVFNDLLHFGLLV